MPMTPSLYLILPHPETSLQITWRGLKRFTVRGVMILKAMVMTGKLMRLLKICSGNICKFGCIPRDERNLFF
jgi:hypothetical protein